MKTLQLLTLCFFLSATLAAQDNSFLVYSFKGNVMATESTKPEAKVKIGRMLGNSATVKVQAGGAVTLICNENAMFTLKKPGTYTLSQLGDSCKVSSNS